MAWQVRKRRSDQPATILLVRGEDGEAETFETRQRAHERADELNRRRKTFSEYFEPCEEYGLPRKTPWGE